MNKKFLDMNGLQTVLTKVNTEIKAAHTDATRLATSETPGLVRPGDGISISDDGVISVEGSSVEFASEEEIRALLDEIFTGQADE